MNRSRSLTRTLTLSALGSALAASLGASNASAQITEVSRTPVAEASQLTFGFLCEDRFVIRNDDDKSVDLEYGIEKGDTHTKITLNAKESVELSSKSKNAVELWKDGKLIAKAKRERRSCKDVQGNGAVTVTPLEVATTERGRYNYGYAYPYGFGFNAGLYDPWGWGYYGLGYRPYSRIVSVPVIINRGGGGGRRGR